MNKHCSKSPLDTSGVKPAIKKAATKMLQQLGCGGKSIYIAQHDFGLPQDLRDPGYMVALENLIEV